MIKRRTPDELLQVVQAEERAARRGYLKIVLGYASGVGKSYRMLDEARRRRERGQDVVIGAMQPRIPEDVAGLLPKLEVTPLRNCGGGVAIDVDRLLQRGPAVCFIDGLAYNNPPGCRHPTRWEDVQDLLNAGIKVVASVNVQYIEELREQVTQITGKTSTETVPVSFVKSADEIEIVDAAPEQLGRTPGQPADVAQRQQQLSKLRELALVLAAEVVDHQLQEYLLQHGVAQQLGAQERILICLTPRSNVAAMLDIGRVIAEKFHGELTVAYVDQPDISPGDREALNERLLQARAVSARIEILTGTDPVAAILEFAKANRITQLFIGHSRRSGMAARLWGNPVDRLIEQSRGMDIRVFPQ